MSENECESGNCRLELPNDPVNPKHYTSMKISPVEYISANNLDFLVGNCIKYISRYKMKNGIEDLMKVNWYLTELIRKEMEESPIEKYQEKLKKMLEIR